MSTAMPTATLDATLDATLTARLQQRATAWGPDWEAPLHFGQWEAEYGSLQHHAGVIYRGPRTCVELSGGDRLAFFNRLATNQFADLAAGRSRETFLTDAKGHVLAYVLASAREDRLVLRGAAGQAQRLLAHLDYYRIADDVQLADHTAQRAELLLVGPLVGERLKSIGIAAPDEPLAEQAVRVAGRPASICRLAGGPPPVLLLDVENAAAAEVWSALCDAGLRPCGRQAWEALRMELAWPEYGRDITAANLPQEVGRDAAAIAFDKGCYLGQETVARIASRGRVNQRLVRLRFAGRDVPLPETELYHEGRVAGRVTSAAYCPQPGRTVGLGYVRREFAGGGVQLQWGPDAAEVWA